MKHFPKIAVVDGKGTAPTVLVASEEFGPGGTTFARSNSVAAWTVFMTWSISSGERLLVINCPPCPCKAAFYDGIVDSTSVSAVNIASNNN